MTNLSSLSKAVFATALGAFFGFAGLVADLSDSAFAPILVFASVLFASIAVYFSVCARRCVLEVNAIARAAAKGDLEPRLVGIRERGELRELPNSINTLIDATDAFVREAAASMEHARHGKFYRKVLETGMLGSFKRAARVINTANDSMREKLVANRKLAVGFQEEAGSVVQGVAGSAVSLRAHAESLVKIAEDTQQRSIAVSAASEEATTNVQTVAAAAEELSASIREISSRVGEAASIAT
jgi:methyl-accepting chemotaxis protein